MSLGTQRIHSRRAMRIVLGIAAATCFIGIAKSVMDPRHDPAEVPAEFCFTSPAAAYASLEERPNDEFAVSVPSETPPPGVVATVVEHVTQGAIVRFTVRSTRPGAVAVHGLMDVKAIAPGAATTVAFRAIYSGRFPLHFHGADGTHFEIVALEVLPATPRSNSIAVR